MLIFMWIGTTFLGIGLCLGLIMYQIRLAFWEQLGVRLLPFVMLLLILVLIPVWVEKSPQSALAKSDYHAGASVRAC